MGLPPYLSTSRATEQARILRTQARLLRVQFILLVAQAIIIVLLVADRI